MDLSIIIPHYQTKKLTSDCIASIYKYTKNIDFEIIVVDNGSASLTTGGSASLTTGGSASLTTGGSASLPLTTLRTGTTGGSQDRSGEYLAKTYHIKLIKNKENYGFGKACNLGAKIAKGKYICICNSDILIDGNVFPGLIKKLKKDPKIGIISPQLVDKNKKLLFSGGSFPSLLNIFLWSFFLDDLPLVNKLFPAYHLEHKSFYKLGVYFDWLQAACWLIEKNLFMGLGGFDENIFMYGEDVELAYRMNKKDLKSYLDANNSVVHLEKGAGGMTSIIGEYKALAYFFQKHKSNMFFFIKWLLRISAFNRWLIFGILLNNEQKKNIYHQTLQAIAQS